MKKLSLFTAMILLSATIIAFKPGQKAESVAGDYLQGNWTFRSMYNIPWTTTFSSLEFATGVMRFTKFSGDSVFGILDTEAGDALSLKGRLQDCGGWTTFYLEGSGIANTGTSDWAYEFQGYVVPAWKGAEKQVDAGVGSLFRAKPHGSEKAGLTASFYMVRQ